MDMLEMYQQYGSNPEELERVTVPSRKTKGNCKGIVLKIIKEVEGAIEFEIALEEEEVVEDQSLTALNSLLATARQTMTGGAHDREIRSIDTIEMYGDFEILERHGKVSVQQALVHVNKRVRDVAIELANKELEAD